MQTGIAGAVEASKEAEEKKEKAKEGGSDKSSEEKPGEAASGDKEKTVNAEKSADGVVENMDTEEAKVGNSVLICKPNVK